MKPWQQYKKYAEWFERAALVFLASLVVQQIVAGVSPLSWSVLLGAVVTIGLYAVAYGLVKKAVIP